MSKREQMQFYHARYHYGSWSIFSGNGGDGLNFRGRGANIQATLVGIPTSAVVAYHGGVSSNALVSMPGSSVRDNDVKFDTDGSLGSPNDAPNVSTSDQLDTPADTIAVFNMLRLDEAQVGNRMSGIYAAPGSSYTTVGAHCLSVGMCCGSQVSGCRPDGKVFVANSDRCAFFLWQ
jgi:hypothetical protein